MDVREGLPCLRSRILLDVLLPLCKTHRHDFQRKARPRRGYFSTQARFSARRLTIGDGTRES